MAQVARPIQEENSWGLLGAAVAGLVAIGLLLRIVDPAQIASVQNFFIIFGSLLVEALPFILLGAVVSALIEVFVPGRFFERLATLPRPLQLPAAGMAGFAFPVCECGSVPVARRLASKGLLPSAAVTFMLAAPILNPVVIASTVIAYRGRETLWPMVFGRAGLGLVAAMAVGWVMSDETKEHFLKARPGSDHDEHDHGHGDAKWRSFIDHLTGDFLFMGRYLVIGAVVAAALQTIVPQSIIGSVAGTPIVDLLAMMALAFVLSLCSESDAFVAASFVQFGVGAQLAFLVFGPMMDTKLAVLYSATFSRTFFRTALLTVAAVVLVGTLYIEVVAG